MANVIVVVGAGVSGLTSALLLSRNKANKVTVVAKHMPGDSSKDYASPWAGANYMPMSSDEDKIYESRTWPELKKLAETVPEAGIHFQKVRVYRRDKDMEILRQRSIDSLFSENPWYRDVVPDFRVLNQDELIPDHQFGCEFQSVCINTPLYLAWLVGQCLIQGVVFKRAVLAHISDAKALSHTGQPAAIIVNATALGSRSLGGVEDRGVKPVRGQTVLVRNSCHPMVVSSGTDDGDEEWLYIMERPAGGGTIIGGTYEIGKHDVKPDPDLSVRMLKRAMRAVPEITGGHGIFGFDIVSYNVGLRPFRVGGVRVEEEALDDDGNTHVVHNYGHSGSGYQMSYGCAERVVELVGDIQMALLAKRASVLALQDEEKEWLTDGMRDEPTKS